MEIFEVNFTEYANIIEEPYHAFGSAAFNELNKDKCDKVFYLLFKDSRYRLGIVGGIRDNKFYSPFSAPFGGFTFFSADVRLQAIEKALNLLEEWAIDKMFESINITLPPSVYNESFIAKQSNCLFRKGYALPVLNLNYAFCLESFGENYKDHLRQNARRNLRIAQSSGLSFLKCKTDNKKKLAYDIISKNRATKGFPLRMTYQQVEETSKFILADFFIVKNNQDVAIASAIVYHINDAIVQVIYWGDLVEFNRLKTMNYLSFKIFEYYKSLDKKLVDLGPSTKNSLPNYGLCEFKESNGCDISQKLTFFKKII